MARKSPPLAMAVAFVKPRSDGGEGVEHALWEPTWASRDGYAPEPDAITREPGESVGAFETRARSHFATGLYLIG